MLDFYWVGQDFWPPVYLLNDTASCGPWSYKSDLPVNATSFYRVMFINVAGKQPLTAQPNAMLTTYYYYCSSTAQSSSRSYTMCLCLMLCTHYTRRFYTRFGRHPCTSLSFTCNDTLNSTESYLFFLYAPEHCDCICM